MGQLRSRLTAVALVACCSMLVGAGPLELSPPEVALGVSTLNGQPVDLAADIRGHDATVLVWWGTTCPCVRRYEERMEALRDRFPSERVLVAAVASNAGDSPDRVREVAAERGFDLPLYMDAGGRLAKRLQVRTTPTAVVLDREGAVLFRGWIDNERLPGARGRVTYVEDAVQAVLEGERAARTSPVYGCAITRSLSEPVSCDPDVP